MEGADSGSVKAEECSRRISPLIPCRPHRSRLRSRCRTPCGSASSSTIPATTNHGRIRSRGTAVQQRRAIRAQPHANSHVYPLSHPARFMHKSGHTRVITHHGCGLRQAACWSQRNRRTRTKGQHTQSISSAAAVADATRRLMRLCSQRLSLHSPPARPMPAASSSLSSSSPNSKSSANQ